MQERRAAGNYLKNGYNRKRGMAEVMPLYLVPRNALKTPNLIKAITQVAQNKEFPQKYRVTATRISQLGQGDMFKLQWNL